MVAREFGTNSCTPEQNVMIEDLLDGFDQNDGDKIRAALKSKCVSALEREFRLLADDIDLDPEAAKMGCRPR